MTNNLYQETPEYSKQNQYAATRPSKIGGLNKAHKVIRTQSDLERINRASDNVSYKIERSGSQREERRNKRK